MRIIPDGIAPHNHEIAYGIGEYPHFDVADTIEISDAQLDWIGWNHYNDCWNEYNGWIKGLSQYLRELISLTGEGK
jgi:hypothetical protein